MPRTPGLAVLTTIVLLGTVQYNFVSAKDITKVFVVFSNHLDIGYTLNVNGSTSGSVFPCHGTFKLFLQINRRSCERVLQQAFSNCD